MVILTLLHPEHQTPLRQWRFSSETLIWVGRSPDNHVVLDDPMVSRRHVELRRVDELMTTGEPVLKSSWHLINHSHNGTSINGAVLSQGIVGDQAVIQLARGGPLLRFQILAPAAVTPALSAASSGLPPKSPQLPQLPSARRETVPICLHLGNAAENLFCIHCGQPVRVEKTVRHYQVLRVLGKGGMGTTYLVWHPSDQTDPSGRPQGNLRVLKEMNADVAKIPKAQELFEREATILSRLDHPGIPKFYDFFVEAGKKYLVMELLHGQDMERWVKQKGTITPERAIFWMLQTCEVLEYLHNRAVPIIHRDIKPGNLLVQNLTDRVIVLDFGAVKAVGAPTGTRIGAEGYSAPEQTQGRPLTQSDLYAIGPSLVFLLTGENPNRFYKKRSNGYRLVLDGISEISPVLRQVIEKLTEPRPVDRYHTARELIQALERCLYRG